MKTIEAVNVNVLSFSELFEESSFPLAVDTYQRGFVWNDEKILQMSKDLHEYQKVAGPKPPYYMGSILLHEENKGDKKDKKLFVIDGQQRLTALCALHQKLRQKIPVNCALTYSPKSARRIQAAARIYRDEQEHPDAEIFSQIVFTVIRVERVDLAFTFFDTQNNRGVPLHATDLLKAYHLRALDGKMTDRKEELQTLCARRWENIQKGTAVMSHEQEFTQSLFSKFLWKARYWTGTRVVNKGNHDALMEEFQKQTWKAVDGFATIPLYRSRHNMLGIALSLKQEGDCEIHTQRISLSSKAQDLPFAIRQPIHEGLGFFLYADKYASLLRCLTTDVTDSREINRFRDIYAKLLMANSLFLREIFVLASLMYVDQFGEEKLGEFSLWLEHALGAIRLDKQQVRYEAAQNFLKQQSNSLNLLDVIANGYRPEQVIDHLRTHHHGRKIYANETIEKDKSSVQGTYKKALLNYDGRAKLNSLGSKENWMREMIAGGT